MNDEKLQDDKGQPVPAHYVKVQLDYMYLRSKKGKVPVLCAIRADTGEGIATEVTSKGRGDEYAAKSLEAFQRET